MQYNGSVSSQDKVDCFDVIASIELAKKVAKLTIESLNHKKTGLQKEIAATIGNGVAT